MNDVTAPYEQGWLINDVTAPYEQGWFLMTKQPPYEQGWLINDRIAPYVIVYLWQDSPYEDLESLSERYLEHHGLREFFEVGFYHVCTTIVLWIVIYLIKNVLILILILTIQEA